MRAAALSFCLLGLALRSTPLAATGEALALASGPKDGVYHRLAEGMKRRLEEQGIEVRIDPKPDCAESLEWLEKGETEKENSPAHFAFAQQDVVAEHLRLRNGSPVRVVDRVAFDYLHVFVRESLSIRSMAELARKRIWVGEEGSATRFTATRFFDSLGITPENLLTYEDLQGMKWQREPGDLQVEGYAVQALPDWFREGRLDAALLVAAPGTPEVCTLMMHGRCSLFPLPAETLRALRSEARFLHQTAFGSLPAWTYLNQRAEVATIAVPVLLLAREDADPILAAKVRAAALEEWALLANDSRAGQGCRIPAVFPKATPLTESGLKLLSGIDRTERRSQEPVRQWLYFLVPGLAFLLAFGFLAKRWFRSWWRWCRFLWFQCYPTILRFAFLFGLGMLIVTGLTYWFERDINENFSSLWESWWSVTVYIFSGMEDRVPYTAPGRFFGTWGLILGWFCSAIVTGWTAGVFVRREKKMSKKLKDHLLLLNWNERGTDILRELHHPVLRKCNRTSSIVVLTDSDSPELKQLTQFGSDRDEAFDDVYPGTGNPTDERDLRQANAQHARTVLILADEKRGDEWTIRSIVQLRKIAREAGRCDLHVMAELIDAGNDSVLKELAHDFPGLLERVSTRKLRNCLLSQAALNPGITDFYTDLLSVEEGTNEVYAEPIPSAAIDKTFQEYSADVILRSAPEKPVIPVGVQRKVNGRPQVYTNPKKGQEGFVLKEGDALVLIAYGPPGKNALPVPEKSSVADPPPVAPFPSGAVLAPEQGS